MTGSIKPPAGGPGPIDPTEFAGELEASEAVTPSTPPEAPEAVQESGTAAWLERVDAGEVTPEQAVDGIVAEALKRPGMQALSAPQREQLEATLRAALLEDPTLSALVGS